MSEHEKVPPYTSPPPYNPHEFPATGFQGPQQMGFAEPQRMSYPAPQPSGYPAPQPSGYPAAQPSGYPAPQSSGYPAQGHHQATVVLPSTTIIQTGGFGESPRQTTCPNCGSSILTRVRTETSNCQHLVCCLMFITGLCTICSCLPYCCDNCANVRHECPRCGTHLGSYTR